MKSFSGLLLLLSLSYSAAITGGIGNFFEDDLGGFFTGDLADWGEGVWDATTGWFAGDFASAFETVGNGFVWLGKESGRFFVSSYNWVIQTGAALFSSGSTPEIPTWVCYDYTNENGTRFVTEVPIRTVKVMFDTDGDESTPDEEIDDVACLANEDGSCQYGWCETGDAATLSDNELYTACTNKSVWSEARDPCVIIYLGLSADPPTGVCDIDVWNPITEENVKQFEETQCFDGDYSNGADECFEGACVPTADICRDDPDWRTLILGLFEVSCEAYPVSECLNYPNDDGVVAADACPVTCNTCPPGSHKDDDLLLSIPDKNAQPESGNSTYVYGAGGVTLGAALLFAFTKVKRRRSFKNREIADVDVSV